jgi:hypothetical protein
LIAGSSSTTGALPELDGFDGEQERLLADMRIILTTGETDGAAIIDLSLPSPHALHFCEVKDSRSKFT